MSQFFTQNDTQRGIKLQTSPRDVAEQGEGEANAQGTGGRRKRHHHPGLAGDWDTSQGRKEGVVSVRMVKAGRERKGPLGGITLGTTGNLLCRLIMEKVGQPDEGSHTQVHARNSLGCPAGEEITDNRWSPAVGGAFQVYVWGGEAGSKR